MLSSKKDISSLDKFLTMMFLNGLLTNDEVSDIQKELQDIAPKNIKDVTNGNDMISLETIEILFERNYGDLSFQKEKKLFQDFFSVEKIHSERWSLKIKDLSINCKLCTIFSDDTYLSILNMLETKQPNRIPILGNSTSTRYRKIRFLHSYGLISGHVIMELEQSLMKKTVFYTTFDEINISINSKTHSNLQFDPSRAKSEIVEKFLLCT